MHRHLFGVFALSLLAGCSGETPDTPTVPSALGTVGAGLTATYHTTLRVPWCGTVSESCTSGGLLKGRGWVGPESGAPNTINRTCADGERGYYLSSESLEALTVETLDATPLAVGKTVRVTANVYVADKTQDSLDLYYASDANNPAWSYLTTLRPSGTGPQTLSTTHLLPEGTLQALRGRFSDGSTPWSSCSGGPSSVTDHDDLVFAVHFTDVTAPVVRLQSPTSGAVVPQALTMTASATDNVGVVRVDFYGDGARVGTATAPPYTFVWNTSPGPHTVSARAYDARGNEGTSSPVSVRVNPAPSVWFVSPEPNALFTANPVHLVVGASDDTAVTQVQFLFPNGSVRATDTTPPYEADLSLSGNQTVIARAFDAAGNTSDATLALRVDLSNPQVVILSPAHTGTVAGLQPITANALDDVAIQRLDFFADDVFVDSATTAPYRVVWNTYPLQDGPQARAVTLRVRAYDVAGRFTDTKIGVNVLNDTTPPTVGALVPAEGQVVAEWVQLSASVTDDLDVHSVVFSVDGSVIEGRYSRPYQVNWNSHAVANGPHTLSVTATDGRGNATTRGTRFVVDNDLLPPVVALSAPGAGALLAGTVTLTAEASDNRAVTQVDFLMNGGVVARLTAAPWTASLNTRASTFNGAVTLSARAYDEAGHVTTSSAVPVRIKNDWSAPALSLLSPTGGILRGGVQVTATASDDLALSRVEFLVNGVRVHSQTALPRGSPMDPAPQYGFFWDTAEFAEGPATLVVRAHDVAGNQTQRSVTVRIQNPWSPPWVSE